MVKFIRSHFVSSFWLFLAFLALSFICLGAHNVTQSVKLRQQNQMIDATQWTQTLNLLISDCPNQQQKEWSQFCLSSPEMLIRSSSVKISPLSSNKHPGIASMP